MKKISIEREIPDISYELIESQIKYLQGQVLTIVEATVPIEKLSAAKSLVKERFNNTLTLTFEVFMNHGLVEEEELPKYED